MKRRHKKSFSDCFSTQNTDVDHKKPEYTLFSNLQLPQEFIRIMKDQQDSNLNQQQTKKNSYYYSEDQLNQISCKSQVESRNQSRKNTGNYSQLDNTISKILEDFEYEELKQNMKNQEIDKKKGNIQINITNNYFEYVNNV